MARAAARDGDLGDGVADVGDELDGARPRAATETNRRGGRCLGGRADEDDEQPWRTRKQAG
jgi:hypothetical protein